MVEQPHAVAEQAPSLLGMACRAPRDPAGSRPCVRASGGVLAHVVLLSVFTFFSLLRRYEAVAVRGFCRSTRPYAPDDWCARPGRPGRLALAGELTAAIR